MKVLAINLERSGTRWQLIYDSAIANDIEIERIEGVNGHLIPREEWRDVDFMFFSTFHGRSILPGEYGCYRSHLLALDRIIEKKLPWAIIAEDDILLNADVLRDTEAVLATDPTIDALKLVNSRYGGFMENGKLENGRTYGICTMGPQGSAACYAVTLEGAQKIRAALARMRLPWDMALERGWAGGYRILTTGQNWINFNAKRSDSQINTRAQGYTHTRYFFLWRLPTAIFRAVEIYRRFAYAFGQKRGRQD